MANKKEDVKLIYLKGQPRILLRKAAPLEGLNESAFIRQAIIARANKVIRAARSLQKVEKELRLK